MSSQQINLKELCEAVCIVARETGLFLRNEISQVKADDIEVKGLHDFVSYVDKQAEIQIVAKLSNVLPEAGFITEEKTIENTDKPYRWVVDPLDGTTNFLHGLPCYSVSIALMHDSQVVLGVVYEVNKDECFYAWEGSQAFLNGQIIQVSSRSSVADSLLATGFPWTDYSGMDQYMELFVYFMKNTHGLRRLGSAAVDLAYVACGRFEGFFEYGLNPWDVAAGAFIVQQAGGRVCDFYGGDNYIFGKQMVASNSAIFEEFSGVINGVFGKEKLKSNSK